MPQQALPSDLLKGTPEDVIGVICHKLRTPLTSAMGFLQLALRDARAGSREGQLHNLEIVDQQLRRLAGMLDEVANMAETASAAD